MGTEHRLLDTFERALVMGAVGLALIAKGNTFQISRTRGGERRPRRVSCAQTWRGRHGTSRSLRYCAYLKSIGSKSLSEKPLSF
jgi:hypothetical protein